MILQLEIQLPTTAHARLCVFTARYPFLGSTLYSSYFPVHKSYGPPLQTTSLRSVLSVDSLHLRCQASVTTYTEGALKNDLLMREILKNTLAEEMQLLVGLSIGYPTNKRGYV